jgi:hypothetical protein
MTRFLCVLLGGGKLELRNCTKGEVKYIKDIYHFTIQTDNNISPVVVAYSLYRYAESKKRYALTVSELYDANKQKYLLAAWFIKRTF